MLRLNTWPGCFRMANVCNLLNSPSWQTHRLMCCAYLFVLISLDWCLGQGPNGGKGALTTAANSTDCNRHNARLLRPTFYTQIHSKQRASLHNEHAPSTGLLDTTQLNMRHSCCSVQTDGGHKPLQTLPLAPVALLHPQTEKDLPQPQLLSALGLLKR